MLSLKIEATGVTDANKDGVCAAVANELDGIATYCSLEGPSQQRRMLSPLTDLYVDIEVAKLPESRKELSEDEFFASIVVEDDITISAKL